MRKPMLSLSLILAFVSACLAQDVTFSKTKYSSVKLPKEADVALTITDSKVLIKGKKTNGINLEIPYSSIDAMSYERATRHRVGEGAGLMALSPAGGAVLMTTKTSSYWLEIEYHEGDAKQLTVLRLDKSEYKDVIATLKARTGKKIAVVDPKTSSLSPTAGSKDMDGVVPFGTDKVATALKSAMENEGCKVTHVTASRVECKRARGQSELTGVGGEKVTATLEAKGEQTRVRIWTGKGFEGRVNKKNWSPPIYQQMMKILEEPA